MKRFLLSLIIVLGSLPMLAQGWPSQYEGVMLQGFYWDSFSQTQWTKLEKQADELSQYFSLVWLPQSANCAGKSMGYDDLYWFPGHYDSSFGTEVQLRSLIKTFKENGIKTLADVTPNEMIQIVRLKHAASLLLEGRYRVNEVCYMVGFSSPSYFAKCFQKQYGCTPAKYKG